MKPDLIHYFDYKSPYAYLAQADCYELDQSNEIAIEWRPYTLDIPSYLGTAELDSSGKIVTESRNAHQWRRVKYAYMDCRREASRRGLTLRGPRKIFDCKVAHIGFLYAKAHGEWRRYHETVYERFWQRKLDIEKIEVIAATLQECGIDSTDFAAYAGNEGATLLKKLQSDAESQGIFGVPSYLVGGELFWGAERFANAREAVQGHSQ